MPAIALLAFLAASVSTAQVTREAPSYSAATIVNAASNDPNALGPYTIIKIGGKNLAWDVFAMKPTDIRNSMVPTVLPNAGVHVYLRNQAIGILNVSPTQITVLIPGDMSPGPAILRTILDGLGGPEVVINLSPFAPGLFANDDGTLVVARPSGDLVTADSPLAPGDTIVVHAVGLGAAIEPLLGLEIPKEALALDGGTTVVVYLNDAPIDPSLVTHVSFVAGQAGIYQLTVQLPPDTPGNPELRIEANGYRSPPGFTIPLQLPSPPPEDPPPPQSSSARRRHRS